jgi:lysophospholipase L1-like esterase
MSKLTRRNFLKASGAATGAALLGSGAAYGGGSEGEKGDSGEESSGEQPLIDTESGLVGTWTASPQRPSDEQDSQKGFDEQTLRLITRTSVGGSSLRIRLANTFGEKPATLGPVVVGIQTEGAAVASGSNRQVTFGELETLTIPPGTKVYSDPVDLAVGAEEDLAVSMYAPAETGPATFHADARRTPYIADSNVVYEAETDASDSTTMAWFFLEGIDVVSPETTGAVVTLGNSITDGVASSLDTNSTYPDTLAQRFNDSSVEKSVLNAGIGGNRVLRDSLAGGPSAPARLDRDVLVQTGVTDVILFEGANDIGYSNFPESPPAREPLTEFSAEQIVWGMKQIIARVHAKGFGIYGATLTPFEGALYYYEEGEEKCQEDNEWIRTSGAFDGVFDFDEALRDPDDLSRLRPKYDSGDHIHQATLGIARWQRSST